MRGYLKESYILIENQNGKTLGLAKNSKVELLEQDGFVFKDFLGTGRLAPYEDWRLPAKERAKDLAGRLSVEDIAGLMLYSSHQNLPARSPGQGTYGGKSYEESGAKPWELTDQQKSFVTKDRVRHVLLTGLESVETAVRWNNAIQSLAENTGFGIPANNSSDPRHSVDSEESVNTMVKHFPGGGSCEGVGRRIEGDANDELFFQPLSN